MGAGAVGGYMGGMLARSGVDVTLIARGAHLEAMRSNGLTIDSFRGEFRIPVQVVQSPDQAGSPVDIVLFCVKSYDTDQAIDALRGLMERNPDARVVCLQNGVSNEVKLAEAFGADRVLSGVVYIGAEIARPGVIRHESRGEIILGAYGSGQERWVERLAAVFNKAEVPTEMATDVRAVKWEKFLFNCALNSMTTLTGCRLGTLMGIAETRALFRGVVLEAEAVARKEGVNLAPDVVERVMATAERMNIRSSMLADFEHGRPIEMDTFNGYVVQLGARHGVATPYNEALYALLKALVSADSGRAAVKGPGAGPE